MNLPSARLAGAGAPVTESHLHDLEAIIRSRTPLVTIESDEEPRVVSMVRQISRRLRLKAYRWSVTEGLVAYDACDQPPQSIHKAHELLHYIKADAEYCLFVLLDFHPFLEDATLVRFLKDIALTYTRHYNTVMIVGHSLKVPVELRPFSALFQLPLPTPEELRQIVYDVAGEWGAEHGRRDVHTTESALQQLIRNLAGLTATDARRLARKAIHDDGAINVSDIPEVQKAKYELLAKDGVLTFEYETAQFADVGGMRRLRKWLEQRRMFFTGALKPDLDPPRGLLLLGVQGCGKSLMAKAAAGIFGVPLLRLDFGALYNKYYGETERNLRQALHNADVLAPCVLWLDEIEKGTAGGGEDDGLSRRVLGTLLTWMSEKRSAVFLVATANDITRLPPELIRKGRFDEVFFVDLPSSASRREIFAIHLRKRGRDPEEFDLDKLADHAEGFSGAEIEQAVLSALHHAFSEGAALDTRRILQALQESPPLSVTMAERVQALRDWAQGRCVPAD